MHTVVEESAGSRVRSQARRIRSRELVARSRGLLARSSVLREACPRFIRGGSTVGPDERVRHRVRERLATGALFRPEGRSWAGRGKGRPCMVCELPVTHHDVEYEIARDPNGTVVSHLPCFIVWRQESEALAAHEAAGDLPRT
jgi:hypothetical protein